MEKYIVLAGHRRENLECFQNQLKSLFGQDTDIRLVLPLESMPEKMYGHGIFLVTCYDLYRMIEPVMPEDSQVAFVRTTVQTAGVKRLAELPEGSRAVAVTDNMENSNQLIECLYQLGITQVHMTPADLSRPGVFCNEIAICTGIPVEEIRGARRVIDLKAPLLDVATILDVGRFIGKGDLLTGKNVARDYLEFVPVHDGITWCLEGYNRVTSSEKILLNVIDGAIISVAQNGRIKECNRQAETMFGVRASEVVGKRGAQCFPQLPFAEVLRHGEEIHENIQVINDEHMIVTMQPIVNSGKKYGAIAVIKRFNDEEKRYNKLRRSLIDRGYRAKYRFDDIIGTSPAMEKCVNMAKRMADSNSSMLIMGESGTGKEMFAQAVHNASERRGHQFVAVNCGAIPESLLESELFGYEEGAFTGAKKGGKAGLFELANKGTIFLDEISEMQLSLQKRLLRVLQEREVTRLGGDSVISVDIRLIAATNRNLRELIDKKEFREDLYYRISVLPISIPPLRSRTGDIRSLVDYFRREFGADFDFTERAYEILERYRWRGNVRELRNYVEYFANFGVKEVGVKELTTILPPEAFGTTGIQEDRFDEKNLAKESGKDFYSKEKVRFILENLKFGLENGKRLGRRSLCAIARREGLFLGEQEIRRIFLDLEKQGFVEIHANKAGTVITPKGLRELSRLK